MNNKVFIAELIQDLPLWIVLFMSVYTEYQNDRVFFASLVLGVLATAYILYQMKKGSYSYETLFDKPSEALPFLIYSFFLLILLIILTFQDRLYMGSIVWLYVIMGSIGEMFFMRKERSEKK
ncbi:hypothetical protein [Persephonella sp.]